MRPLVYLIAALGHRGVYAVPEGGMPWKQGSDLRRFRELTAGCTVIMGRRTWESLPGTLPGRAPIVVTSTHLEDVRTAPSLEDALDVVKTATAWVIGGAQLWNEAIVDADGVFITRIDMSVESPMRWVPVLADYELDHQEEHDAGPRDQYAYTFESWFRRKNLHQI